MLGDLWEISSFPAAVKLLTTPLETTSVGSSSFRNLSLAPTTTHRKRAPTTRGKLRGVVRKTCRVEGRSNGSSRLTADPTSMVITGPSDDSEKQDISRRRERLHSSSRPHVWNNAARDIWRAGWSVIVEESYEFPQATCKRKDGICTKQQRKKYHARVSAIASCSDASPAKLRYKSLICIREDTKWPQN